MLFPSFYSHLCLLTDGFNFFSLLLRSGNSVTSPPYCPAWLFSSALRPELRMRRWPCHGHSSRRLFSRLPSSPMGSATRLACCHDLGTPQMKGKLQFLLLAISALDQPVGLLDGWLIHKNGVLGVAGLQGVVLLVLVSCNGKETR